MHSLTVTGLSSPNIPKFPYRNNDQDEKRRLIKDFSHFLTIRNLVRGTSVTAFVHNEQTVTVNLSRYDQCRLCSTSDAKYHLTGGTFIVAFVNKQSVNQPVDGAGSVVKYLYA